MAEFVCELCNYKATRKGIFNIHLGTRKHINNKKTKSENIKSIPVPEIHSEPNSLISTGSNQEKFLISRNFQKGDMCLNDKECQYCHKVLARKYNLIMHYTVCKTKLKHEHEKEKELKQLEDEAKKKLEKELELMKLEKLLKDHELALEKKEVEYLKREISIKDQCSRTTVKTCNNALKFAKMHFLNPRDLTSYDCRFVEEDCSHEDTMDLVDKFIHHEINEMGPSFITDIICKYYKTPNIFDQSIHNSDVQRRTFVLYLKKMWSWDKEGNIVKSVVITPFLKQMLAPLNEYMNSCNKQILSTKKKDFQSILANSYTASKVVTSIENGSYSDKVLATLASKFYLDTNDDKLLTN